MEIFVGIDVAKDRLDVHVHPVGERFHVVRDANGLAQLVERLRARSPTLVAVEATGGFEKIVVAELAAAKLPVWRANPAQVRAFAQALGRRAKTDTLDAATIAHYAEATRPQLRPLPDADTEQLADLITRRRQIIQMMVAERQRQKRAAPRLQKSIVRLLKALQKELSSLEQDLDETISGNPLWQAKEELLTSVPGVGKTLARTLLAEMPELGTLPRRPIAALAGVAPWTRRSGKWRGQSFIGGGRANVRAVLYMAALAAARFNPQLAIFYRRLRKAGKKPKEAIIAVARKLLTILNAILRDRQPWQSA